MVKKIKQYRYYGDDSTLNSPQADTENDIIGISKATLFSGAVFQDYMPIVSLGIQAKPGTTFRLNNSDNYLTIGATGIYELTLEDGYEISSLKFFKQINSLEDIETKDILNEDINGIIIDTIYEDSSEDSITTTTSGVISTSDRYSTDDDIDSIIG